jgi:hypothetical protein
VGSLDPSKTLRALNDGNERLDRHRLNLTGIIRNACPGTMIRHLLTPLMGKLVKAFPNLKTDRQDYSPAQGPFTARGRRHHLYGVAP